MSRADRVWLAVAVAGFLLVGGGAVWLFGDRALYVLFTAAIAWLIWDRVALAERVDQASDDADQAIGRVVAVEHHLSGVEPPSTGRHSDGQPQAYRTLRRPVTEERA